SKFETQVRIAGKLRSCGRTGTAGGHRLDRDSPQSFVVVDVIAFGPQSHSPLRRHLEAEGGQGFQLFDRRLRQVRPLWNGQRQVQGASGGIGEVVVAARWMVNEVLPAATSATLQEAELRDQFGFVEKLDTAGVEGGHDLLVEIGLDLLALKILDAVPAELFSRPLASVSVAEDGGDPVSGERLGELVNDLLRAEGGPALPEQIEDTD